jgi:hypothetical protein
MKYLKPVMFLIAGFAITLLVSFKNDEPKKEYATLFGDNDLRLKLKINNTDVKISEFKRDQYQNELTKVLNNLANENWKIISSDAVDGQGITGKTYIYLERTKQ